MPLLNSKLHTLKQFFNTFEGGSDHTQAEKEAVTELPEDAQILLSEKGKLK